MTRAPDDRDRRLTAQAAWRSPALPTLAGP
jgi:hypothetical protein